jgi:hypothetical protein
MTRTAVLFQSCSGKPFKPFMWSTFVHCLHFLSSSTQHHVRTHMSLFPYIYVCICYHQSAILKLADDELTIKHVSWRISMLDPSVFLFSITSSLRTAQSVRRLVKGIKLRIWIPNSYRNLCKLAWDTLSLGTVGKWGLFRLTGYFPYCTGVAHCDECSSLSLSLYSPDACHLHVVCVWCAML